MNGEVQPKMIPNPLYCEVCYGRGYVVYDAEWSPYAVKCPFCENKGKAEPIDQSQLRPY